MLLAAWSDALESATMLRWVGATGEGAGQREFVGSGRTKERARPEATPRRARKVMRRHREGMAAQERIL